MTHSYVLLRIQRWYDTFIRDMTHSYVTWHIHTWHDTFIRDMTHSYVTWRIHRRYLIYIWHVLCIRDMTCSHVTWRILCWMYICISFECIYTYRGPCTPLEVRLCVTWLIHLWHDLFIHDMAPAYLTWHIHTGRQRPIGCLNLHVTFRKRATYHRALLRKMTYKDNSSYGSSPPCMWHDSFFPRCIHVYRRPRTPLEVRLERSSMVKYGVL